MAKGAAIGAALGAAHAAVTAGDIGEGALHGAIGGAFGGAGALYGPAGAIAGASVGGAVSASISGGDPLMGALSAGIGAGIGHAFAGYIPTENLGVVRALKGFGFSGFSGAIAGGISAELQGGDFWDGAANGAIGAVVAYGITVDLPDAIRNQFSPDPKNHLFLETVVDAGMLVIDVASGNWVAAAGDIVGLATPGLPSAVTRSAALGIKGSLASARTANMLKNVGKVDSIQALRKLTSGFGGKIQAHHIFEQRILKAFNIDSLKSPGIILTGEQHKMVTNVLQSKIPVGLDYKKIGLGRISTLYREAYEEIGVKLSGF